MTALTPPQRQFLTLFLDALTVARSVEGTLRAGSATKRRALRKYRRLHGQAVGCPAGQPGELVGVLLQVGEQPGRTWEDRAAGVLGRDSVQLLIRD